MNGLKAIAKLTRIEHSLMLVVAVLAAELIAGGIPNINILALSLVTPILTSMGAFAINDYFDVQTDKENKRLDRPIVSGAISKKNAYNVAVACLIVGAAASLFINAYAFVIALLFALFSYLYSYKMKDILLLGNIYVAISYAIPFIYGNFVVSPHINITILLISFVVFLAGLAREIHGMIRDRAGDIKVRHSNNLISHIGVRGSATFAFILYAEAVAISIFIFVYSAPFMFNLVYAIPITIVGLVFLYLGWGHIYIDKRKFFDLSRNLSLAAMSLALLAYLFSAVFFIPI